MRLLLILFFFSLTLSAETRPSYTEARKELPLAWEKTFPLPFANVVAEDPLRHGIHQEKRSDKRVVWIYNFKVFMPKYDRNQNEPSARTEGREIVVFFLWEPSRIEDPYRIQLGDLNQNL